MRPESGFTDLRTNRIIPKDSSRSVRRSSRQTVSVQTRKPFYWSTKHLWKAPAASDVNVDTAAPEAAEEVVPVEAEAQIEADTAPAEEAKAEEEPVKEETLAE